MQLVVGGAYSGKRRVVRERIVDPLWISAYSHDQWTEWSSKWTTNQTVVFEGFEEWILEELNKGQEKDQIRQNFRDLMTTLSQEEQERQSFVTLIMLEMGRGIVPIDSLSRDQRDLAGWVLQDAALLAEEVHYVWNGLSKKIK